MLLYHDLRAPNPRRVRWFFAEKNVPYDTIEVSIDAHANQTPEFRRKNPIALLPVLELADGKVLRESIAICRYIEELYPEPNLFGADAWERATIEQWNRHAELELFLPITAVFRNTHAYWKDKIKQAPEFGQIMRDLLASRFDWFENELATREYIGGPRFTIADITACCAIDFARASQIRIDAATHPHFAAWHARMKERPGYKA